MDNKLKEHWNNAYLNRSVKELGWYESIPEPSLDLIQKANAAKDSRILVAGAGASTLIDYLLNDGYTNITVCDISNIALDLLKKRLGAKASHVQFIHDDLLDSSLLVQQDPFDLWIDRAVFHFFTKESEMESYHRLMEQKLAAKASILIASFTEGTVPKCSGLEVKHHTDKSLSDFMSEGFDLIESFESLYTQPSGNTRDYVYTLFKKKA